MDNRTGYKRVDLRYLKMDSEFLPPKPLPFGAHKYIRFDGDRIPNKGTLLSTVFTVAIVTDGVEGEPFSYKVVY